MRDTIITARAKKRELRYLGISFIIAFLLNILSIILYHTEWKELYTQLVVVIKFSVVIYIVIVVLRLIIIGVARLFGKNLCKEE
jgi:RsiW-degrading membrane proteinase PrsW (M82 family)